MPGSYNWPQGSIWHPYGCKCSQDPMHTLTGCNGAGQYYSGPLNPTEYNQEFINKKNTAEAMALKEYQEGLTILAPLGPHSGVNLNDRADVKYFAERLKRLEFNTGKKLTWEDIYCNRYV